MRLPLRTRPAAPEGDPVADDPKTPEPEPEPNPDDRDIKTGDSGGGQDG